MQAAGFQTDLAPAGTHMLARLLEVKGIKR